MTEDSRLVREEQAVVAPVSGPNTIGFLCWIENTFPTIGTCTELITQLCQQEGEVPIVQQEQLSNLGFRFSLLNPRGLPAPNLSKLPRQERQQIVNLAAVYLEESGDPLRIPPVELAESILIPFKPKRQVPSSRHESYDRLDRFKRVPFKAILLFSTQDDEFWRMFRKHSAAISEESENFIDYYIYEYRDSRKLTLRQRKALFTFARDYVNSLWPIPGANFSDLVRVGLPCILVWTKESHAIVPFGDIRYSETKIQDRIREILRFAARSDIDGLSSRFLNPVDLSSEVRSDVFVSYTRSDFSWVSKLTKSLEDDGFSIWFDRQMRAGDRFDLKILFHIENSAAIVVVWSAGSQISQWVKAEAALANDAGKLVPVFKDGILKLPPPV